ncbi:MAG: hypothetical protein MI924_12365, partial [Chloroflexales bacterium]|nr:hypothetical protein [Chloroflexales bacterium]
TKKDLFIATMERVYDLTLMAFQRGSQQNKAEPLSGMGEAFKTLIDDNDEMSVILQCMATVNDPDVQRVARRRFRELYDFVREHGQVDDFEAQKFLGQGFYLAFVKSIDFDPADTNAS